MGYRYCSKCFSWICLNKDGVIETLDITATTTASIVTLNSISVLNIGGVTSAIDKDVVVFTWDATNGFDITDIAKVKDDVNLMEMVASKLLKILMVMKLLWLLMQRLLEDQIQIHMQY